MEEFTKWFNSIPKEVLEKRNLKMNMFHAWEASSLNTGVCTKCGQVQNGQGGEYPCPKCGVPTVHDTNSKMGLVSSQNQH